VILPTVAEVGGRVRVSAEVIDPRTQTTVYTETAEGTGIASTLDSIDAVTASLRGTLGEAVKTIEKDSMPLPQVATKNLDALRAYALGQKAYAEAKWDEALAYFERALTLDPEFALARMGIVRIEVTRVETARARASFAQATKLRDRLPPRDALYLDAWSAEFGEDAPLRASEKWKLLSGMYPDYFAGHANYAWNQLYLGKYAEALEAVKKATAKQNPLQAVALDQQGRVQLAMNNVDGALKSFQLSVASHRAPSRQMAAALAAKRNFSKAANLMSKLSQSDPINQMEAISIAIDQGDLDRAIRISQQAEQDAAKRSPFWRDLFGTVALSVRVLNAPDKVRADEVLGAFERTVSDLSPDSDDSVDRLYFAVTTIYLVQRAGLADASRKLLPKAAELAQQIKDARVDQLLAMVRANQKRFDATPDEAVADLSRLVDGTEQFQVHVALRDALLASGRPKDALVESQWLARSRGLAYAEQAGAYVMQPLNVADTTAARPDKAGLSRTAFSLSAQR
jgi:putative peptide modification system cyclase